MKKFDMTTPQQNIWNLHQYYTGTAIANQCGAVIFDHPKDVDILINAIRKVIREQSALRLRLVKGEVTEQYIAENDNPDIPTMTFTDEKELNAYAERIASEPVTAYDAPLYRFAVFCIKDGKVGVLAVLSHLIADAWSFSLLIKMLDEAYRYLAEDKIADAISAADYATFIHAEENYLASDRYQKDREYWEKRYTMRPEPSSIKTEIGANKSAAARRVQKRIKQSLNNDIDTFCDKHRITPAVLFETAMFLYLTHINPQSKAITIGVPVLNRASREEKRMIGMFISTMPLTVDILRDMTARELLDAVTSAHREAFRHQHYPYSEILKNLREHQDFVGNLYDVMVSVQNAETGTAATTRWYFSGYSELPLTLHVDDRDSTGSRTLTVDYQTAVFLREQEIELLIARLEYILTQVITDPSQPVQEIGILPDAEQELLVKRFNNTRKAYPQGKCVHDLFAEQVARMPEQIALVFDDKRFTYRELDKMSNTFAHLLRSNGVGRNDIVPIIAHRDWRVIVAILGILKAGGAYMPVSPDYPLERIRTMLDISGSRIVLCYGYDEELPVSRIDLDEMDFEGRIQPVESVNQPDDLCYVIFTSGSTGTPKGVCQTHKCIANLTCEQIEKENPENKKILATTTIIFDVSVQEILYSLIGGGILYFSDDDLKMSPQRYMHFIKENAIDVAYMTPSYLNMLLEKNTVLEDTDCLVGRIILAGEDIRIAEEAIKKNINNTKYINQYGPAETHVATEKIITDCDHITIGCPIANTQIYILDEQQNLLPIGVAGELCIAGDGVGKGYLNQPVLTAEKFIPNPFATEENHHGKTMYRTGDLARWREDGEIEYLGRIDTQVKIRGLRIELGEIENVMAETEGIGLVAAAARKDERGRQYLIGYYTSETELDEKAMRKLLSGKLPKYMVPNYFMRLDRMPMTPSGKIDRKNLPLPDIAVSNNDNYTAPETEIEKILCHIMANIIGVERVGVIDDFFDLGGDSLSAISFVTEAHSNGIEIKLQDVFDHPTIRELCDCTLIINNGHKDRRKNNHDILIRECECYKEILKVDKETSFDERRKLGNVFLTGVTGFLGAHVLDALMRSTEGKIYCLIRSEQKDDRRGRLEDSLQWYFGDKYKKDIGSRIIPIVGNIERVDISNELPDDVQTIIHTAATVKHFGPYKYFESVNVEGTRHVVDYARRLDANIIHISTIGLGEDYVSNNVIDNNTNKPIYDETCFYVGQPLDNVYIRSKFYAEKAILDEIIRSGLHAKIIRVGNLSNRSEDYMFQKNYQSNAFLTRLKSIIHIGVVPDYLMNMEIEFSPVDLTAEGIVKIAQIRNDNQVVFHLYNDKCPTVSDLLSMLEQFGIALPFVSGKEFYERLQKTEKAGGNDYIFESLRHYINSEGEILYTNRFEIKELITNRVLQTHGFEWNCIDDRYIKGYWEYFKDLGYWVV